MNKKPIQTKMVSSTLMNPWVEAERKEEGKIMKTDVFVKLFSQEHTKEEMARDIAYGFQLFREFANQFSRFEKDSQLSCFNMGSGGRVSEELFFILKEADRFYKLTEGIFDPSILPALEKIGYKEGIGITGTGGLLRTHAFDQLIFDEAIQTICKPKDVFIDLGGIGKGYIVDKVSDWLMKKYEHGIVDAGGDMRIFGSDRGQNIDYFAIDVEDPFDGTQLLTTLCLTDCAVATSGINRRKWRYEGKTYHHIIDPAKETSAETGLVQVTVIAPSAIEADVFAKTLFILGLEKGQAFATEKNIPALFVTTDKHIIRSVLFQKYEWKA